MLKDFGLDGRIAVVTGATGDIGRVIALTLAEHGADVAVLARRADVLEEVAAEIRALGRRALVVRCDVTDPTEVAAAAEAVTAALGTIDVLVNNAGGARFVSPAADINLSGWNKTVALNLTAPFLLSQAFGRGMLTAGRGAIVNVASLAGLRHLPGMAAYSSAKGGLLQQTKALAREWALRNVRVNAVAPGFIDTSAWDHFNKATVEADAGISPPMGRWATAAEVALPVAFLASDAASYITGTVLVIDGGMLA